ncbi:MAG: M50 family metallopeptidase [Bacillota bacterium]|nr:M50 family metallopeptidase [Bacillota bacterium]
MKWIKSKFSSKFFLFIIIAVLLVQLPILGDYVRVLNTVIHESGHAVIALFGGHLEKIALLSDSEGITYGPESGKIEGIFSSMAGYICSSFMGFFSFWLIRKKKYTLLIDILLGILFLNLILWVRNLFGMIWIVTFAFGFLLLLIKGKQNFINHFLLLIASILLVDSVKSSFEIFEMSIIHPKIAGDAANLSILTSFIPAQAWGVFFLVQALFFPILAVKKGLFRIEGLHFSRQENEVL